MYRHLTKASPQKFSRPWMNDSVPSVDFPHSLDSYNASHCDMDLRQQLSYNLNLGIWSPVSQFTPQSEMPSLNSSWNMIFDPCETKPIIYHHPSTTSCSPLSTVYSSSVSPSPVQKAPGDTVKSSRKSCSTESAKICSHCHATSTPLWRREPSTHRILCNACGKNSLHCWFDFTYWNNVGLYLQQRHKLRPQELINADLDDESEGEQDPSGPECSHCHTRQTSVWRRSRTGTERLCNACMQFILLPYFMNDDIAHFYSGGVYSRLRGRDRPLSLKRNKIKPRTKHSSKYSV